MGDRCGYSRKECEMVKFGKIQHVLPTCYMVLDGTWLWRTKSE